MKEREASEDGVYFCDEIMDIKYKGPVTLHNNGSKYEEEEEEGEEEKGLLWVE